MFTAGCAEYADQIGIAVDWQDKRSHGNVLPTVKFTGQLRVDQQRAVDVMLNHDTGILHAPTAFGKTVIATRIIAERRVNTLILVHSKELVTQWQERLQSLIDGAAIGVIHGESANPLAKLMLPRIRVY